jgi:3-hydroxyisobutyrate dehydrogenase-like beta-hydroxyacid dehydrogenase
MDTSVGLLGLGIMGSAMAANLRQAGFEVIGYDISAARMQAFAQSGGVPARSAREVAGRAGVLISVLPSAAALDATVSGADGILAAGRSGLILVESSTFALADKQRVHDVCREAGVTVLDCPLSGTGAQALTRDLSVYASGDAAACERCAPVFAGFARSQHYVGAFGNGSKMKFVANLLVAIHNVSAAEAFVLGMKAGLDAQMIYDVVGDGAGSSRMFQVRGPLMVRGEYRPATMKVDIWQKDMKIISEFAAGLGCPTPLLAASAAYYTAAMAQGRGGEDTAAVCAVLEQMARLERGTSDTQSD